MSKVASNVNIYIFLAPLKYIPIYRKEYLVEFNLNN